MLRFDNHHLCFVHYICLYDCDHCMPVKILRATIILPSPQFPTRRLCVLSNTSYITKLCYIKFLPNLLIRWFRSL